MEFELWWLLGIPVFFALGWIAARVDIRQLLSESRTLPRDYFRGLNFLLNDQPDKAIDAFIEIVKLDTETADMHFALGHLFRRRGETERAIRFHLDSTDGPLEQHCGLTAYRNAVGLRKALDTWMELRAARRAQTPIASSS